MRIPNKTHKIRKECLKNIRRQKPKYPELLSRIIEDSDIILEVLDARFPERTRNEEVEEQIKKKGKKIIYVLNKSDLIEGEKNRKMDVTPNISVSSRERKGIKKLRDQIKIQAKKIKKPVDKTGKISIGVIGYPNTGKSSLINILIGKSSAGVGSDAGFTKGIQKLRLDSETILLDSPGVIPEEKYSATEGKKIAEHTLVGGRSYSQVKEPEMVISNLMKEYSDVLEENYGIDSEGDSEILIQELGKKKGFMKKGGEVDEDKTARYILKDWQTGKIPVKK